MGPLEFIYYIGYSLSKSRGLKRRRRLPCRVISVGNLTVGGTGKTPAVIAIAEEAKRRGFAPCVLTRGYKGRAKGPCFISRGSGPLLNVDDAGDEAFLMAEKLREVPVVKGSDRYEAGLFAIRELESQISNLQSQISGLESRFFFILDDGFQHWKLARDMDILLVDSTDPFGGNRLLPSGRLREPLNEISRADVIVLTRVRKGTDAPPGLVAEIRRHNPGAPLFFSEHAPAGLLTPSGTVLPLDVISGKAVFAFSGIGNPSSFRESLIGIQANLKGFVAFGDHHPYTGRDLRRVEEDARKCGADWIVTTEKDIMRLREYECPGNLLALSIAFAAGRGFYDEIFAED